MKGSDQVKLCTFCQLLLFASKYMKSGLPTEWRIWDIHEVRRGVRYINGAFSMQRCQNKTAQWGQWGRVSEIRRGIHNLIPSADLRMYLLWALSCKQVFSGGGRWILSNALGIDNGRVSVSISFSQLGRCEVGLFGLRQDCPTIPLCWDWKH